MKKLLILFAIFTTFGTMAQSLAINADGSAANPSAMLDVSSTTKGLLPPRMTNAQKTAIATPAAGLIVYCTNCGVNGEMQYYNGVAWINFSGAAGTTVPGAPTSPIVTPGNAQVSVAFTAPTSNGGSAITGYTVTSLSGNFTATGPSSPLVVTGLTNGTSYTFTVIAANIVGNSSASVASVAVTPSFPTSGVLVAPGVTKQFLSHNLGADLSLDPHVPVVGLQGAYIQWGQRGPNTTENSRVDWQTAANTANFAAAPTGANANAGAISGWNTTAAANGSWGATKTATDPCPTGYRVPTSAEWTGVNANNTASRTGTFANSSTEYGSALHYGPNASTKLLTLPTAGYRNNTNGEINSRGNLGLYWSSTESGGTSFFLRFDSSSVEPAFNDNRTYGFSLRCIAE